MATGSKKFPPCLTTPGWRPPEPCWVATQWMPSPRRHGRRDVAHAVCRKRGPRAKDPRST